MELLKDELQPGQISDVIKLRGCLEMALMSPDGDVLERRKVNNVVVTAGRSYVLSRLISASPQTDVINFIGVGTSTTAPATGDTLLGSEALRVSISTFITAGLTNNPPSWQAQCTSRAKAWGRSIAKWMREFSLIGLNPEMQAA